MKASNLNPSFVTWCIVIISVCCVSICMCPCGVPYSAWFPPSLHRPLQHVVFLCNLQLSVLAASLLFAQLTVALFATAAGPARPVAFCCPSVTQCSRFLHSSLFSSILAILSHNLSLRPRLQHSHTKSLAPVRVLLCSTDPQQHSAMPCPTI